MKIRQRMTEYKGSLRLVSTLIYLSHYPRHIATGVERVKKCIDVNVEMNEITLDGDWDETSVGEFLSAAYHVYEAY
jgi:hypothetical protein